MFLNVSTDRRRSWLALSVSGTATTDRRCSWLALSVPCRALGSALRPSTHRTHKLGLTGYIYIYFTCVTERERDVAPW